MQTVADINTILWRIHNKSAVTLKEYFVEVPFCFFTALCPFCAILLYYLNHKGFCLCLNTILQILQQINSQYQFDIGLDFDLTVPQTWNPTSSRLSSRTAICFCISIHPSSLELLWASLALLRPTAWCSHVSLRGRVCFRLCAVLHVGQNVQLWIHLTSQCSTCFLCRQHATI